MFQLPEGTLVFLTALGFQSVSLGNCPGLSPPKPLPKDYALPTKMNNRCFPCKGRSQWSNLNSGKPKVNIKSVERMNPYLLRQLWSLIEGSQNHWIQSLDDNSLVHWLIDQISGERVLNATETDSLSCYIRNRLPLIRDLAQY
jgi:hypothetical protein